MFLKVCRNVSRRSPVNGVGNGTGFGIDGGHLDGKGAFYPFGGLSQPVYSRSSRLERQMVHVPILWAFRDKGTYAGRPYYFHRPCKPPVAISASDAEGRHQQRVESYGGL